MDIATQAISKYIFAVSGNENGITNIQVIKEDLHLQTTNQYINAALEQLQEYFRLERDEFDVVIDQNIFTKKQWSVYRNLMQLPAGEVISYKNLASISGMMNGQRAVGMFMAKNPLPIIIPCHRVVKSDGSLGNYYYGLAMKAELLYHEQKLIKAIIK